jgi:hypothetical protein
VLAGADGAQVLDNVRVVELAQQLDLDRHGLQLAARDRAQRHLLDRNHLARAHVQALVHRAKRAAANAVPELLQCPPNAGRQ